MLKNYKKSVPEIGDSGDAPSRSSSRSEKFRRSLSIPLGSNSNIPQSSESSTSSQTSPTSVSTPMRSRSFLSGRSNSVPGISNNELSLGKKIKRRLSSKKITQLPTPSSSLLRTRSNSLKLKNIESSSTTTSPIFQNNSFVDITEDYFKYDWKRRNESNASSTDSYLNSIRGSSNDPLDQSSQKFDDEYDSVYSSVILNHDLTLTQIQEKTNITIRDDEDEEEEIAESMAFDILEKIKEMSFNENNDDIYSV